jgi:hypothetical protein
MPAFRTSGSTGPAPNTVWMSPVADKFTMQLNGISGLSGGTISFISFSPTNVAVHACNFANQFLPIHTSFGSFITAPDGTTNTAQKIVEDNTTNYHYIEAGMTSVDFLPNTRMAGIFKAAERTRIAFTVNDTNAHTGLIIGFDLAGGQIAYGPSAMGFGIGAGGDPYRSIGASMVQVAPGWWLCIWDFNAVGANQNDGFNGHCVFGKVVLDNGSGTAAASVHYAGDGASGVYGWRCSTLPVQAWSINTTAYFDDFNDPTLGNIDKNGTYADGFDWYLNGFTPGYLATQPLTSANLSQSGSALTILPQTISAPYTFTPALCSWGNPGDGRAKGARGRNVHIPPALFEVKMKFPFGIHSGTGNEQSISFFQAVEFSDELSRSAHVTGSPPYIQGNGSIRNWNINGWAPTWGDVGGGSNFTPGGIGATTFITAINPANYTLSSSYGGGGGQFGWGVPQWNTFISNSVGYFSIACWNIPDSTAYTMIANNPPQPQPPTAAWSVVTYPPGIIGASQWIQPMVFTDMTQYHVYTTMILPYDRVNQGPGSFATWVDGVFTQLSAIWDPNINTKGHSINTGSGIIDTVPTTTDWQQIFWMIQTGYNPTDPFGFTFDYAKVMR